MALLCLGSFQERPREDREAETGSDGCSWTAQLISKSTQLGL